jgi:hypothetical protein
MIKTILLPSVLSNFEGFELEQRTMITFSVKLKKNSLLDVWNV